MSAAPQSVPDPAPSDAEGWALLDGLRRRLDDQAAQTRKTAAQVGQLAESIAALVAEQRRRSRWLNLNSFAAYCVFTVLLGGAFYFVYASRARELVGARDRAIAERDAEKKRADDAIARLAIPAPAPAPAAPVVAPPVELAPDAAAIAAARAAIKAGRFVEVGPPLEALLAKDPHNAHAPELHYLAGVGRGKTGDFEAAVKHLQAALAGNIADDDARFQLASALDHNKQFVEAKAEYEKFAAARPQSPFASFATRRAAMLARPPAAPTAAAASPPVEPAPVQ